MDDPLSISTVIAQSLNNTLAMAVNTHSDSFSLSSDTITNDPGVQSRDSKYNMYRYFQGFFSNSRLDKKILLDQKYPGNGTKEYPFRISFLSLDPQNPSSFPRSKKWFYTSLQALATLATTFASSAYSGGIKQVIGSFDISQEIATLGISLYVLGFALGPLVWAPLSELYGRRKIFFFSFMAATAFSAGAGGSGSISALLVLRFLAGSIGSAPLSNAPGVIADMFDKSERGMAMCMFSGAPFLGPAIGTFIFLLFDDICD